MTETKEISYPLERSSALVLLGNLWTGKISGQILVGAMLFIGVLFLGNQGFNILSIGFFLGFILPVSRSFHIRLVRKGKKLMGKWCDLKVSKKLLQFKTGFPNTMDPQWQEVEITKENKDIIIKGGEVGGYHLRLTGDAEPAIRLGLWVNLEDAKIAAEELAGIFFSKVAIDISSPQPTGE